MRFQAYFTPVIKIILYVMAALSIVGVIVAIVVFAGVSIEITVAQATLLLSVSAPSAVVALVFATMHYKVDNRRLRLYVGFVDVFGGRVGLDNILNIVIKDNKFYISYLCEGAADPIITALVVRKKRFSALKKALMDGNPNIVLFEEKNETGNSK